MENFVRLYQGDNARLMVKDARGRSAVHLAAAKNRVTILQFVCAQQGSKYRQLTMFVDFYIYPHLQVSPVYNKLSVEYEHFVLNKAPI